MRSKATIIKEDILILKHKIKECDDIVEKHKREVKTYKDVIVNIKKKIRSLYCQLRELKR